jgi:ABC-2 type transport system ATP-binding protein
MEPLTLIRVSGVSKSFGKHVVLSELDLDIRSGEIFGVVGMSGVGKSTLLNLVVGAINPDSGDVSFRLDHLLRLSDSAAQFRSVFRSAFDIRRMVGFASQSPSFYPLLTVYENLDYFGSLYGLSKDSRRSNIDALLLFLDLDDSAKVLAKNLSGGMQKRLDIGCALMHDPKVLVMDEPTADLDPILREQMWDIIRAINSKGTTIIIASHFLDELEFLCDRIGLLFDGKMRFIDSPENFKKRFSKATEIEIITSPGNYKHILSSLGKNNVVASSIHGRKLVIRAGNLASVLANLLKVVERSGEKLIHIEVKEPSMREAFGMLVNEQRRAGKR